ncbi:Ubiquitin carboxyl-terminal hydrolase [Entamoeba marina]
MFFKGNEKDFGTTGLCNLGNTCYSNAVVQCLAHTPSFVSFCFDYTFPEYYNHGNKMIYQETISELLIKIVKQLHLQTKPVSSKHFQLGFNLKYKEFEVDEQKDAAEFLTLLLDTLDNDLRGVSYIRESMEFICKDITEAYIEHMNQNISIITEMVCGMIKTEDICSHCKKESHDVDQFQLLQLPIPKHLKELQKMDPTTYENVTQLKYVTLYDCLNLFKASETNCVQCGCIKQTFKTIAVAPPILIFQLLRFCRVNGKLVKDTTNVIFPINDLVIGGYKYSLYALVEHTGALNEGHFTSICKVDTKWYKFNDENVKPIKENNIPQKNAYILFYQRIGKRRETLYDN